MPLTPADVHNVAFSKPPIGKRGYNEDEVDAFLDLVEAELARLIEDNNELRNQVEQLDQRLRAAEFEIRFLLRAGELVMFDNCRLLHGRTGFDPSEGLRHLQGCYIDIDGPRSLWRVLRRRLGSEAQVRRSA